MLHARLAYRLTQWPELEPADKTAHVLRTLSRMTMGPVTSNWFLRQSRLAPAQATRLLQRMSDAGALQCIELAPEDLAAAPEAAAPPAAAVRRPVMRGCAAAAVVALAVLSSAELKHVAQPLPAAATIVQAG